MTEITQQNLYLLLPFKVSWVADMLCADEHISVTDAIRRVYSSDMYKELGMLRKEIEELKKSK